MSLITAIVHFTAKAGQRDTIVGGLSEAIQGTINKPDCYKAELLVDQDSDTAFAMVQHWTNSDAHRAYVDEIMQNPMMLQMMDLMEHPPKTSYFDLKAAGGGIWGGPGHLEISSNDTKATAAFLTDVFDWCFTEMMKDYDGFWAPGALMGGLRPKMDEEPAPQTVPYLIVDDLDARLERVSAAGGTIVVPIQEIPGAGRFFWFLAPGGLTMAAWESAQKA